jgi:hypothetical protein
VEWYVKTVEEHMRKVTVLHERNWDTGLPIFLLAYRASKHDTVGLTTANLVFGRELCLPCDLLFEATPDKEDPPSATLWICWTNYTTSTIMSTNI